MRLRVSASVRLAYCRERVMHFPGAPVPMTGLPAMAFRITLASALRHVRTQRPPRARERVPLDARIKLGPLELLAEAFTGEALAGLGGGGIGQNLGPLGATVRTKGGWAQLNFKPARAVTLGGGCGLDNPNDDDLRPAVGPAQGRLKNFVCMGHIDIRPSGPLVFGFEYPRLTTTYRTGEVATNHLNVAAGWRL